MLIDSLQFGQGFFGNCTGFTTCRPETVLGSVQITAMLFTCRVRLMRQRLCQAHRYYQQKEKQKGPANEQKSKHVETLTRSMRAVSRPFGGYTVGFNMAHQCYCNGRPF